MSKEFDDEEPTTPVPRELLEDAVTAKWRAVMVVQRTKSADLRAAAAAAMEAAHG